MNNEKYILSFRFCFAKNCFISALFTQVEWNTYCDWHRFLVDTLPLNFDGFIYLRADPKVVLHFVMCSTNVIIRCTSFSDLLREASEKKKA